MLNCGWRIVILVDGGTASTLVKAAWHISPSGLSPAGQRPRLRHGVRALGEALEDLEDVRGQSRLDLELCRELGHLRHARDVPGEQEPQEALRTGH